MLFYSKLEQPEEGSASESASEVNTWVKLYHYPGIARPSLAKTGYAARLV
jgi:hypothetical protein